MEHREQLEWEARAGRIAGISAFLVIALTLGSQIYLGASIDETPERNADDKNLRIYEEFGDEFLVSAVLGAVARLLLLGVIFYLYRATRYRRPRTPTMIPVLAVLGVLITAGVGIWGQIEQTNLAQDYVEAVPRPTGTEDQRDQRAEDFIDDNGDFGVIQGVGFGGNLALGIAIVLLSLNAMRAGLLSRFMGILGIIVGCFYVLPQLGGPILQVLWLPALGLLFFGRWPGGRGPAWESGEEEPWPSAASLRAEAMEAQRQEQAEARADDEDYEDEDEGDEGFEEEGDQPSGPQHPSSKKRKRKRRR